MSRPFIGSLKLRDETADPLLNFGWREPCEVVEILRESQTGGGSSRL